MHTSTIINQLKQNKHRITKAREAIIEMFVLHTSPITAKDVEEYLEKRNITVNKATIYREITFLINEKIITEVHLSADILYYEIQGRPHHHHVVCTNCGKIEDIHIKKEDGLIEAVAKKTQYRIDQHSLEFYGFCVNCK